MKHYLIDFEYQMPGDDEFNHTSYSYWYCTANDVSECVDKWTFKRENSGRSQAKFAIDWSIREITEKEVNDLFS